MAIQDEGSKYVKSALDALKRLGATEPVLPDYRGSFALVGYAGANKPLWIAQKIAKRGLGPSKIAMKIPLIPKPTKMLVGLGNSRTILLFFVFLVCSCCFGWFLFLSFGS